MSLWATKFSCFLEILDKFCAFLSCKPLELMNGGRLWQLIIISTIYKQIFIEKFLNLCNFWHLYWNFLLFPIFHFNSHFPVSLTAYHEIFHCLIWFNSNRFPINYRKYPKIRFKYTRKDTSRGKQKYFTMKPFKCFRNACET